MKYHLAENECSIENRWKILIKAPMPSFLETSRVSKSEIYM